jgi:general secretion pathway protein A
MYESYWQLDHKPFENSSESRFYYPAQSHQAALLKLRYAIENRRAAALLTGPSGSGKTLIAQTLAKQLPEKYSPVVHLVYPQLPADQLVGYLADELTGELTGGTSTIEQNLRRFETTIKQNCQAGRQAVVIVDEAHLLRETAALETLRLLLNYEHDSRSCFTLLLLGQPAVLSALARLPELEERMDAKCLLGKLTLEETISYISHRLTTAGAKHEIFDQEGLEALHYLSQGIPRRLNRLADLALVVGYAEELPKITSRQIEAVAEELLVPVHEV